MYGTYIAYIYNIVHENEEKKNNNNNEIKIKIRKNEIIFKDFSFPPLNLTSHPLKLLIPAP